MTTEECPTDTSDSTSSRKGSAWVAGTLLFIVLYFMSPIFVAKALSGISGSSSTLPKKCFRVIYAPAKSLYDHWEPYQRLIHAQERWLGL